MALVRKFEHKHMERNSLHDEISATYTVFDYDDRSFIQIDTYGRDTRALPGKKSQTVQLDRKAAEQLFEILKRTFQLK